MYGRLQGQDGNANKGWGHSRLYQGRQIYQGRNKGGQSKVAKYMEARRLHYGGGGKARRSRCGELSQVANREWAPYCEE